jgi:hypothetical protein
LASVTLTLTLSLKGEGIKRRILSTKGEGIKGFETTSNYRIDRQGGYYAQGKVFSQRTKRQAMKAF